jgi:PAS domain S-box-containing protein
MTTADFGDAAKDDRALLRAVTRLYRLSSQLNQAIVRIHDRDELFAAVCRIAVEVGGFRMSWIGLVDEATGTVQPAARAGHDDGYLDSITIRADDHLSGRGPTGSAVRDGVLVIANDIASDPRMLPWRESASARGYRASAAIPLRLLGRVTGTLNLYADEPGFFTQEEQALLNGFGVDISFALDSLESEREHGRIASRLEETLRASEERFRIITSSCPDHILVQDLDLRYTFVLNPQLGMRVEDFLGRTDADLLDPDDAEKLTRIKRQVLASGTPIWVELPLKNPDGALEHFDGTYVPKHDAHGRVDGLIGYFRVVTAQKRAEAALRDSEERFRNLVETVQELIWKCDASGRFVYLNPAWERTHGYTLSEMLGRPFTDFMTPDVAARDKEEFSRHMHGGSASGYETTHLAKDGRKLTLLLNAVPLFNESGQIIGTQGTATDISDRKQAEEAYAQLQAELLQAQKMESVGRLAGGVAHDFNNMLGVILGHAKLALDLVGGSHPLRADLLEIQKAAGRSADLTRQLLGFARRQTILPKVLDVNAAIDGTLTMLRRLIGEQVTLDWRPSALAPRIKMDPSQLSQILTNLCVNARDAIDGPGAIVISTAPVVIDDTYCAAHIDAAAGRYVALKVRDDGSGIAPEVVAHLFEPFFTTKPMGVGTGLGLATVYGIVKQNAGFIHVETALGQGTTFSIFVPEYVEKPTPVIDHIDDRPTARGRETILLVEDEPAILRVSQRLIERLGYRVLPAASASAALTLATDSAEPIHLLITDVVMPEMNGGDLADRVRALHPQMKRILMSGYTADVIAQHGVVEAGVHFLQKPFSAATVARRIRDVLDQN